jgi:hypothetical protein
MAAPHQIIPFRLQRLEDGILIVSREFHRGCLHLVDCHNSQLIGIT